mgnify:CR=1 FL=1
MSFTTEIELERTFEVNCSFDRVFNLLADVPRSVSHFPNVDELVDLGDGAYRWEMEKIGVDKYSIQTIYACTYYNDYDKGRVWWEPIEGEGNGLVEGSWQINALDDEQTEIHFYTKGELEIPLPFFVKMLVAPIVKTEFSNMVDTYMENLEETLNSSHEPEE